MSNTERVLYFPEGKIMKTIICDDEKSTCSELEEIILKYAKEKSVSLVTEVFYSGDTLLDYLKREKINILFLDIELPGKDGVMVGKYIPSLTVAEIKNRCIPCVYWGTAIFVVVMKYSNLFFSFAFFLDRSHFAFGYELIISSEAAGFMKIICNGFTLI